MVALTGGLLISVATFTLARDTSRFYSNESRFSAAGVNTILGFQRLKNDLLRAGYLSSPALTQEVRNTALVCNYDSATWPDSLKNLRSVLITKGASAAAPDTVRISGSFSSTEQYPIRTIEVSGSETRIYLQANSGALARTGSDQASLNRVFATGRFLRLQDPSGRTQWSIIASVTAGGARDSDGNVTNPPYITLASTPALVLSSSGGDPTGCALRPDSPETLVNVVNVVEYRVASLYGVTGFSTLIPANDRTELVREEFDAAGNAIPGSLELIAEYAVAFKLGVTATSTVGENAGLVTYEPTDANSAKYVSLTDPTLGTQRLRGLRVLLGTRVRGSTGDREGNGDPGFRVAMPDGTYARVRTLQTDIALRNQARVPW